MTPTESIYADVLSLSAGVHVTLDDFHRPDARNVTVDSTQAEDGTWTQTFVCELGYVIQVIPIDDLGVRMGPAR